jgi:hypothetical protein
MEIEDPGNGKPLHLNAFDWEFNNLDWSAGNQPGQKVTDSLRERLLSPLIRVNLDKKTRFHGLVVPVLQTVHLNIDCCVPCGWSRQSGYSGRCFILFLPDQACRRADALDRSVSRYPIA